MTETKQHPAVVDLIDHLDLLHVFRGHVDECIQDCEDTQEPQPMSFDDWYRYHYLPHQDDLTTVVEFRLSWETAAQGYLTGSTPYENHQVRIPADIVTETGGIIDAGALKKFARKLADRTGERLPTVLYRDRVAYKWCWD